MAASTAAAASSGVFTPTPGPSRLTLAPGDAATREGLTLYLRIAAEHVRRKLPTLADPDALEHACTTIEIIRRAEGYVDENVNVALVLQQLAASLERQAAA